MHKDRTVIPFLEPLCARSVSAGGRYVYTAAIALAEKWPFSLNAGTLQIAGERFDLANYSDFEEKFRGRPPAYTPYPGHRFLWPSDERFLIYSDGDTSSYIAGDKDEILGQLELSYEYCLERTKGVLEKWLKDWTVVNAWLSFCDEFI